MNKPRTLAVLATTAFLACAESTAPATGLTETTSITIADNRFTPSANLVNPGQSVTWTWTGSNSHSVNFDDASLSSSGAQSNGTFSQTFPQAGSYTYFCSVHGRDVMSGRVVVGTPGSGDNSGDNGGGDDDGGGIVYD